MTTPLAKTYRCSRCGAERHLYELNGYNAATHDASGVYCRRLLDCQSAEANAALKQVVTAMYGSESEMPGGAL